MEIIRNMHKVEDVQWNDIYNQGKPGNLLGV